MSNAAAIERLRAAIPSLEQAQATVPTLFDVQNMGDDEVGKVLAAEKVRRGLTSFGENIRILAKDYEKFINDISISSPDIREDTVQPPIEDIETVTAYALSFLKKTATDFDIELMLMRKYLRHVSGLKLRTDSVRISELIRAQNHALNIVRRAERQLSRLRDEVRRFAAEPPKPATNFPPQPPEQVDYDAVIDSVMARTSKARAYLAR